MSNQLFPLHAGVIIIGSLWWEGDEKSDPKNRFKWRLNHLGNSLGEKSYRVKLPIRYGRYSDKGGFYTMTFSPELDGDGESLGVAFIVGVYSNPLSTYGQLRREVKAMANAEGMTRGFIGGGPKNGAWATIGFMINTDFQYPDKIREWWKEQIEASRKTDKGAIKNPLHQYKTKKDPKSILTSNGEMNIDWPKAVNGDMQNEINNLDILFAACTMPRHESGYNRYPTPEEIANAEMNKPASSRDYFHNNRLHGITTFQDPEILELLKDY